MSETLTLALDSVAGLALGAIFFGGLWLTVRMALSSRQPALWFFGGLLLRMGIALGGFLLVAGGQWERLLACLAGFVVARIAVTSLTRLPQARHPDVASETIRAP
jgi:F1F0 ATPase subunit 2